MNGTGTGEWTGATWKNYRPMLVSARYTDQKNTSGNSQKYIYQLSETKKVLDDSQNRHGYMKFWIEPKTEQVTF